MENFVELTVSTTHIGSEIISDIMWEYTENGVVISDIQDVIEMPNLIQVQKENFFLFLKKMKK